MSGSSNTVKVVMVPYDEYVTLLTNAYKGRKDRRQLTAKQKAKVNDILYKSLVLDMTTREVSQQPREVQEVAQQVLSGERQ